MLTLLRLIIRFFGGDEPFEPPSSEKIAQIEKDWEAITSSNFNKARIEFPIKHLVGNDQALDELLDKQMKYLDSLNERSEKTILEKYNLNIDEWMRIKRDYQIKSFRKVS
jgi:hypothetical protein